jgi:hypothetical protein
MPKRNGSVHVATTRRTYNGKVYVTHLLRRSFRQGDKVKHQTLGNLSHLPPDLIDTIRHRLAGQVPEGSGGRWEIVRSLPHGHVVAVLGSLRRIGLDRFLASRRSAERDLATALIVMRLIAPQSKLATSRGLVEATATSSLPLELQLADLVQERDLYQTMDWLLERQPHIEKKLAEKHLKDGTLVLYDVTSSYYTGHRSQLVQFGHNRDGRNGCPQIVYGLLCSPDGCPVAIEVFEGNTADPNTLNAQIQELRKRFKVQRVVLVGDRGMITTRRINESFRDVEGLEWISALRADSIKKLVSAGSIQPSLFDQRDLAEIEVPEFPGERLEDQIAAEAALGGLYVIRTSISDDVLNSETTVRAYKDLAKVERAFRCMKTIDLRMRPIYHWMDGRFKAHVFLCMLAYYVEWHMRRDQAPILFDDHDRASAQADRKSIVTPSPHSKAARAKDHTQQTEDGFAVHSFRTLLADLGTLCKNRIRVGDDSANQFYMVTKPTDEQCRILALLGIKLSL